MSNHMIAAKCTSCGADLHVEAGRESFFCQFCGAHQTLEDANHRQYTYRSVDDARIREADAREAIRLKELEIEHLRLQHETQQKRFMMWTRLIAIIAYFLIFALIVLLPHNPGHSMDLRSWLLLYIPLGVFVFIFTFRKVK